MTRNEPSPSDLAKWTALQEDMRALSVQRALRFVAASILAPFGTADIGRTGTGISAWAFAIALLLLAVAEMAAMAQAGLLAKQRSDFEKEHPTLAPRSKPGRQARLLGLVSGPAFSTALYALLGAGVIVGHIMR